MNRKRTIGTRRRFFVGGVLGAACVAFGFACGSDEPPPAAPCDGAGCADASTDAPATGDGPAPLADGPIDGVSDVSRDTTSDAAACVLPQPAPDAGPSGAVQWAFNFGVTGYTTPNAVAMDPTNGDIVVVGTVYGSVDFGGGLLTSRAANANARDAFVAKFTSDGRYKWAKVFGNGFLAGAQTAAVDPAGEVAIGGFFMDAPLDAGGGQLSQSGDSTLFVARFDSNGIYRWAKSFGTPNKTQNISRAAFDPAGNIVFAGRADALDFGGGARTGFFVAALDGIAGAHIWSKGFPATTISGQPSLVLDPAGNPVIAGNFGGTVDFGGGPLAAVFAETAFVAKFDRAGAHQWSKAFPTRPANPSDMGSSRVNLGGLSSDACGNIFLAGSFGGGPGGGALEFGTVRVVAPVVTGASHGFLAKLSPWGDGIWGKGFLGTNRMGSSNGTLFVRSASAESSAGPTIAAHLVGSSIFGFEESVDLGGGAITNSGESSLALATFDEQGNHRWSYGAGLPSTTIESSPAANHAVASNAQAVVVVGTFGDCSSAACMTSPPGKRLVLGGKTLTAVGAHDTFIFRFAR